MSALLFKTRTSLQLVMPRCQFAQKVLFRGHPIGKDKKSTSLAQITYYDNFERFRRYYNLLWTRKKKFGFRLMGKVCKKRSKSRNSCSATHTSLWVQSATSHLSVTAVCYLN